jgi:hypothetical protein
MNAFASNGNFNVTNAPQPMLPQDVPPFETEMSSTPKLN